VRLGGVFAWEIARKRLGNAKFSPLRGDPKTSKVHPPPLVEGSGGALKSSMVHGWGVSYSRGEGVGASK